MVALLAAGLGLGAADAATPTEGTVSDASTTRRPGPAGPSWPPTPAATRSDAARLHAADRLRRLHAARVHPAGYGTTHTLNIKVCWTNTAADFDVYVLDKAGNVVGTSALQRRPRAGRAAAELR